MKSLRICHLGKFYPPAPGGIESHVRSLACAQARLGARVKVICVNHTSSEGSDITWRRFGRSPDVSELDGEVEVVRVGRVAGASRLELCPSLPGVLRRAAQHSDLMHVHAPNVTMYLALVASPALGPLVVTHHSDIVKQRRLAVPYRLVERLTLARAALVLSTSADYVAGSRCLRRLGDKVQPLPLGIDLQPYLQPSEQALDWAREFRHRHGAPLWLCVGRLVYYKGLDVALKAIRQVPGNLMIVGRGPIRESLERRAEELGVAERVLWYDYLEPHQLAGAYRAATALWFPSVERSEGFGLVQVEAMASGCPVINTRIPGSGVSWVSPHEVSGLTVPVGDAEALALASRRLLSEVELRRRLTQGAVERAVEQFTEERMGARSLELYRRVV